MQDMNLLQRIDEVKANSVTPERFMKVWGVSIEQHLDEMMAFVMDTLLGRKHLLYHVCCSYDQSNKKDRLGPFA